MLQIADLSGNGCHYGEIKNALNPAKESEGETTMKPSTKCTSGETLSANRDLDYLRSIATSRERLQNRLMALECLCGETQFA